MERTLKLLSEYQIQALKKGIEFNLDLSYNTKNGPVATVEMNYSVAGDMPRNYIFNTTFTESLDSSKREQRLGNIKYFIETIVGPNY